MRVSDRDHVLYSDRSHPPNEAQTQHLEAALPQIRAGVPDFDPILAGVPYAESSRARQEPGRVDSLRRMMDYGAAGRVINQSNWDILDLSKSLVDLVLSDKPVYRTRTFREPEAYIAVPIGLRQLSRRRSAPGYMARSTQF